MAQLIFDWLNEEVRLSRRVISLGDDFRDGYLLGELLYRYNQQPNFNNFSSKGNPDSKINNFCLIEPTMRQVGVPFNSKIASEIMNAKESTVKKLLYELKTALESILRNSRQQSSQNKNGYNNDKILCVIGPSRPMYDKTMSLTFENAVRTMIENPNEIMMEHATRRFQDKKGEFRQTISAGHTGMMHTIQNDIYRSKEIERHRKEHVGEFAEAWESINVSQWRTNQKVARERRELKKRVEFEISSKRETQHSNAVARTRDHTFSSIDEFDNRLEATILSSSSAQQEKSGPASPKNASAHYANSLIKTIKAVPGGNAPELVYIDQTVLKDGLVAAQKKMKEHHENKDTRQQANDRRRRRFLREFDTRQIKQSNKFFEKDVVTQLLNYSQSEVQENREMDRALSHKKIMAENRDNRCALIQDQMEQERQRNIDWRRVEAQREVEWVVHADFQSQMLRRQALQDASSSADRQQNIDLANSVVLKVIDMVEWVISCRTLGVYNIEAAEHVDAGGEDAQSAEGNPAAISRQEHQMTSGQVVPDKIWRDAVTMFTSALEIAQSLPPPQHVNVTLALKPFCISDRPLCMDTQWLFAQSLSSHLAMHYSQPNIAVDATDTLTSHSESVVDCAVQSVEVVEVSSAAVEVNDRLARHLAQEDTTRFLETLNATASESVVNVSLPISSDSSGEAVSALGDKDLALTPEWLLSGTAPQHLLGETVIALRLAVDPIPEEPAPVVQTAHIPLRAAICGVSDLARRTLALELQKQIPGLLVLRTEELVQRALMAKTNPYAEVVDEQLTPPPEKVAADDAIDGATDLLAPNVAGDTLTSEKNAAPAAVEFVEEAADSQDAASEFNSEQAAEVVEPAAPRVYVGLEAEVVVDAAQVLREEYASLCDQVFDSLSAGAAVSDSLYVSLIVHAIKQVPPRNNGFVLQDFPNTKTQVLLLMEALSGIRYDIQKPQAVDRASVYAPFTPCEEVLYDIGKCGLDIIVYADIDGQDCVDSSLDERVRARKDLFSGETVYVADDCASVFGLQEIFNRSRPYHTSGLDLTAASEASKELCDLLTKFNVLDVLSVDQFGSLEEAASAKAGELCCKFIPVENLQPDYFLEKPPPEPEPVVEEEEEVQVFAADLQQQGVDVDDLMAKAAPVAEVVIEEPARVPPPPQRVVNAVPRKLASALNGMWDLSERQSQRKSNKYFNAFRDVRYQFVQRRRCAVDCLNYMLMRLDRRQELFDSFRARFNEVESDLRFDPDCIAELSLQTLELGDAIYKESEARKVAAQEYVRQISVDGVLALAVHRCSAESAVLAQAEMNRFYVALHMLFDFTKAVKGFDMQNRLLNEMEVTLPLVLPSLDAAAAPGKGGKDKPKEKEAKPAKDAKPVPVPFREPVPAVLVPSGSVVSVPEPKTEVAVDPKAKKPAKEKKGAEDSGPANPFRDIEALIVADIAAKWSRTVFAVNREVYEGDQALCSALEQAVWFEAEKLLKSIAHIGENLAEQVRWLEGCESNLVAVLNDLIVTRFHKELAAGKLLLSMIADVIEVADPIEQLWVVAPDAMPPVNPQLVWQKFYEYHPKHKNARHQKRLQRSQEEDTNNGASVSEELSDSLQHVLHAAEQAEHQRQHLNRPMSVPKKQRGKSSGGKRDSSDEGQQTKDDSAVLSLSSGTTSRPSTTGTAERSRRPSSSHASPNKSAGDEQFRKQQEKYQRERKAFEERLLARRHEREEDFTEMGMSPSCAKLAAFNELLLEEEQQLEDFESHHKPPHQHHHKGNHHLGIAFRR